MSRQIHSPIEDEYATKYSKFMLVGGAEGVTGKSHVLRTDTNGNLLVGVTGAVTAAVTNTVTSIVTNTVTANTELPSAVSHADAITLAAAPAVIAALYAKGVGGASTHSRITSEAALSEALGTAAGDQALHMMLAPKRFSTGDDSVLNFTATASLVSSGDEHDVRRFTHGRWHATMQSTGVPIDMRWILQMSPNAGTDWFDEVIWFWNKNVVEDTALVTAQSRMWPFTLDGMEKVRMKLVTNISSGGFAITNAGFTFQAR